MLTSTKNTLLNKVLRLEIDLNEAYDNDCLVNMDTGYQSMYHTIGRNIQSIKKQLRKL